MADTRHYNRPPITEAVMELRFEGALNPRELERVRDRFKARYPTIENIQLIEVLFEGNAATPKISNAGFKMIGKNAVDLVMVQPSALGTVRLAPYENWEKLREVAEGNWEVLERVLNTRKRVIRIGCRFINRIDIPTEYFSSRPLSDFFPTFIRLGPNIADRIGSYAFNMMAIHKETGAKLTLQSATVQQPVLLDHTSVTLDTDAYWDADIPLRVDEMWARADKLRQAKNSVFENSITDLVRDLFK